MHLVFALHCWVSFSPCRLLYSYRVWNHPSDESLNNWTNPRRSDLSFNSSASKSSHTPEQLTEQNSRHTHTKTPRFNENVQSLVFICFPCLVLKTSQDVRFNLLCENIYLHSIYHVEHAVRSIYRLAALLFCSNFILTMQYISILVSKIGICIVELKMRREFECWKYETKTGKRDKHER